MDTDRIKQPASLDQHQPKYKPVAWRMYTVAELGGWVHLFAKRAEHRDDPAKRRKDLEDARNYWAMIGAHLDALDAEGSLPALRQYDKEVAEEKSQHLRD